MRETVRVTLAVPDEPGVAVVGLKLHCVFVGKPTQLNETVPENPADPLTDNPYVALLAVVSVPVLEVGVGKVKLTAVPVIG